MLHSAIIIVIWIQGGSESAVKVPSNVYTRQLVHHEHLGYRSAYYDGAVRSLECQGSCRDEKILFLEIAHPHDELCYMPFHVVFRASSSTYICFCMCNGHCT